MARLLGYAYWNGKKRKKSGTVALAEPGEPGLAALGLHRWLRRFTRKTKDGLFVTYEMPIAYGNRTGVGRGFHLEGILIAFCEGRGIPYRCVPQPTLKKHSTGNGRADKEMMIAAAAERWGFDPCDDNEADALCVLGWTLDLGIPKPLKIKVKR